MVLYLDDAKEAQAGIQQTFSKEMASALTCNDKLPLTQASNHLVFICRHDDLASIVFRFNDPVKTDHI